jgi:hypothetical protein
MRLTAQIINLVVCITIIVFGVYGLIYEESQSGSILVMILGVLICLFNIKRINRRFPK